jgi:hypothetical protein
MTRERTADTHRDDRPSDQATGSNHPKRVPMAPGDEAPAGTPGTGEAVCHRCGGEGKVDGRACPDCQGSGTVIAGIGGA